MFAVLNFVKAQFARRVMDTPVVEIKTRAGIVRPSGLTVRAWLEKHVHYGVGGYRSLPLNFIVFKIPVLSDFLEACGRTLRVIAEFLAELRDQDELWSREDLAETGILAQCYLILCLLGLWVAIGLNYKTRSELGFWFFVGETVFSVLTTSWLWAWFVVDYKLSIEPLSQPDRIIYLATHFTFSLFVVIAACNFYYGVEMLRDHKVWGDPVADLKKRILAAGWIGAAKFVAHLIVYGCGLAAAAAFTIFFVIPLNPEGVFSFVPARVGLYEQYMLALEAADLCTPAEKYAFWLQSFAAGIALPYTVVSVVIGGGRQKTWGFAYPTGGMVLLFVVVIYLLAIAYVGQQIYFEEFIGQEDSPAKLVFKTELVLRWVTAASSVLCWFTKLSAWGPSRVDYTVDEAMEKAAVLICILTILWAVGLCAHCLLFYTWGKM